MEIPDIRKKLQQTYFRLLIPAAVLILIFYLVKILDIEYITDENSLHTISVVFFVLGAVFSLALPIFYRTLFISKMKDRKSLSLDEFVYFEKNLISLSMISPFIIIFPVLFNFSNFYFSGIVLFALYSIYYYYPSKKRIDFEKKLFRIKDEIE